MSPYNYQSLIANAAGSTGTNHAMTINSLYGQPLYHQVSRSMFMAVKFTF